MWTLCIFQIQRQQKEKLSIHKISSLWQKVFDKSYHQGIFLSIKIILYFKLDINFSVKIV